MSSCLLRQRPLARILPRSVPSPGGGAALACSGPRCSWGGGGIEADPPADGGLGGAHPPSRQVSAFCLRFIWRLGSPGAGSARPPESQGSSPISGPLPAGPTGTGRSSQLRALGREATLTEERKRERQGGLPGFRGRGGRHALC